METIERLVIVPLQQSLEQVLAFLPQLLAAFVIALCGLVAGWVLQAVLLRLFGLVKCDDLCSRIGLIQLLGRGGIHEAPSRLLARFCGGLTIAVFLLLALNSLEVAVLKNLSERFLAYLPNVLVAVLVLLVALLFGNFCGRAVLIACVNAGNRLARLCARLTRGLVLALGIVMALEQLGIGREAVLIAFAIAFGGVVLALAIAFGLGGRKLARDYLERKLGSADAEDELHHL